MSDAVFVRSAPSRQRRPPTTRRGALGWVRDNLFADWLSGLLTLGSIAFVAWALPGLVRYFIVDAVWDAPDGAACRAADAGACWAFVAHKLDFFRYGSYPLDQRWRVDLTLMAGFVLIARLLWPPERRGRLAAFGNVLLVPLASLALSPGLADVSLRPQRDLALLGFGITMALALWQRRMRLPYVAVLFFAVYPVAAFFLLHGSRTLGLPRVDTTLWGGIFVTLLISIVGIVVSLPLGVLLALGRRSQLPVVSLACAIFIEVVRGVPLITVLFMANTMLPLFVPENLTPDRLLRPLIGVALFAAAYMAETVRGGLQALPRGQYEGAMALGLGYRRMMRLVILPQALVMVIPGIVNSFISLFKDTTLVAIVGIFDFLRTIDSARLDPAWAGPGISPTAYVFAGLFYWIFCFGMSRYSLYMERRLGAGGRR
jgi:general L-amino acid transport system permease protein